MLFAGPVDLTAMISRLIRFASIACVAILLLSFGLFVYDQASGASQRNLTIMTGQAPVPAKPGSSPDQHQPRKFIDGAAQKLTEPVRSAMRTNSVWAVELAATIAGLLVYGVGLGFLARVVRL